MILSKSKYFMSELQFQYLEMEEGKNEIGMFEGLLWAPHFIVSPLVSIKPSREELNPI